jgi:hypothetical protein
MVLEVNYYLVSVENLEGLERKNNLHFRVPKVCNAMEIRNIFQNFDGPNIIWV